MTSALTGRSGQLADVGAESLGEVSDQLLARRAADGDVRAFEMLMRRYGSLMSAYAARLGDVGDTDDVVQETFITAWQDLPSLEKVASVRNWLITIVTRKSIDRLRGRRDQGNLDDHDFEDPADGPLESASATSLEQALSVALSSLPDDQRRCWTLREITGLDYQEIAAELQIPVSTVRGLLARGRKTLTSAMEQWR